MKINEVLKSEEQARAAFIEVLENNRAALVELFQKSGYLTAVYDENYPESIGKTFFHVNDQTSYQEKTAGAGDYTFNLTIFNEAGNIESESDIEDIHGGRFWEYAEAIYRMIQDAAESLKANGERKTKLVSDTRALFDIEARAAKPCTAECKCEGGEPKAKTPPRRKPAAKRRKRPAKKEKALFSNMVMVGADDPRGEAAAFPFEPARKQAKPEAAFISDRMDTN